MLGTKAILLFMLLQIPWEHTKAAWLTPYFKDTHTYGVQFQSSVDVQKINVREELAWPFQLAKVNYEGDGIPTLGAFDIGDNSLLGAKLLRNETEWNIIIEKRQDYENPQQRIYYFQIYIKDSLSTVEEQGILLTLENIFDNNPSVTYSPSPCQVEELHSDFITNCIFSIYDPDGMDRNNVQIMATGQNNEADLFDFTVYGDTTTYEKKYKLRIKEELHYEEKAIYNLDVVAIDAGNNTGRIFAILEVIDLPNRPPVWVRPLTTATFNEKQEQNFTLKAIDGDTGINKPICYRLEFEEDYSHLMSINATSGILHVTAIDRDALNQQVFTFYTCAYKCDNVTWAIKNTTILIVQDINDHIPEITLMPPLVQILEAKYLTLPLDKFLIEDIDLGNNATYSVYFPKPTGIAYSDAISLIPDSGYQRANFSLTVLHAESMDYENEDWRNFEIMIIAQEIDNQQHTTNLTLTIALINWNDEWPIFMAESYEASVLENATMGTLLQQVYATDRDVDDKVIHTLVGKLPGIDINANTGILTTSADNVFDYERQTLLLLQIQAKDTLITTDSDVLHTTFAQLTIHVVDVNDETPELRMPRSIVNITENSAPYTLLTDKIEAHDPDTTANLTFEIIWTASYATKSGQEAESESFVNCFIVESKSESKNLVFGLLRINPEFKYQVDYEKYDTIFLTIKVTDLNQEINDDSATAVLTVRIDDVNDNAPEFKLGTLQEPRKVTEMEENYTVIGTIEAFDIDGPGNNIITFDLSPIGNLTENGLVSIDNTTGVIRVQNSIQCDIPKIYNLEYEIILTDLVHTTIGKINISIIDINNRVPVLDIFEQQVAIYENATTGDIVGQIIAHDDDRDVPHNVLEYTLNSALGDVYNLFQINTTTGQIMVNLHNNLYLDRDNGVTYHYIAVDIKDNFNYNNPGYGPVNQKATFLNVTLLDVNDNAPIMPMQNLFSPEFSEADLAETYSKAQLVAVDKDEPNTPNSWISYKILSIEPVQYNAENVSSYADLFDIVGDDKLYGQVRTLKALKGFYGLWRIEIEAFDHGVPIMRNSSMYEINVRPFNFHAPSIQYPLPDKSIRVCYALQEPNRPLYQADCITRLPVFEAFDPDGGEYGDVTFQLSSDVGDDKFFKIVKETRNQSSFYLQQTLTAGIYHLNLRATDGGGSSSKEIRNLKIVFVDMLGNPMFLESSYRTNFTENDAGMLEQRFIPAAYDPKNEGLDGVENEQLYPLYYFIDATMYPEDAKLFHLNSTTRQLTLTEPLDREAIDIHRLRIKVTNNENGIISNPNSVNYTIDLIIEVNDVNDNPPVFTQRFYAAGITPKDVIGKEILIFHAEDPDLNDPTFYQIDMSTFKTHGQNIAQQNYFTLNNSTGVLNLDAYITNIMKGYFQFDIVALDTAIPPHSDVVSVKIYIVSEANRVKFVFLSDMQTIRDNANFIIHEFQSTYGYEICNIDSVDDVTSSQRISGDESNDDAYITDVIVHFIDNNEAVDARDIQRRSTDLAFVSKLQNILQRRNLILNDVPHLSNVEVTEILDDWLLMTLVVVCILLAALCAILVVVFVLKMRTLKRQLKAFEPTEFGSIASNLNRFGAPSANIFSVERSNPVILKQNHQGAYDANISFSSESEEEDEFDGLQDDPIFIMNNAKNLEHSKLENSFEHKILNNEFFTKEKTTNKSVDNDIKLRF